MAHTLDLAQDTLGAQAAHLAEAGWRVLPTAWPTALGCSCEQSDCPSPGKHPLTEHGKDDATDDPDQVRQWWARWPWANIGVRPPEGVVILDVDPRNGADLALAEVEAQHGRLPITLTARTGSGGWHLWFRCGLPVRGRLCEGVDVKTHTGYVLVPPSRHVSGGSYRWHHSIPLAPLPIWAMREIDRRHTDRPIRLAALRAHTGLELVRTLAGAHEGRRNHLLYWAARCVHEEYQSDPALLGELERVAQQRGLSAQEVHQTLRSAAR